MVDNEIYIANRGHQARVHLLRISATEFIAEEADAVSVSNRRRRKKDGIVIFDQEKKKL